MQIREREALHIINYICMHLHGPLPPQSQSPAIGVRCVITKRLPGTHPCISNYLSKPVECVVLLFCSKSIQIETLALFLLLPHFCLIWFRIVIVSIKDPPGKHVIRGLLCRKVSGKRDQSVRLQRERFLTDEVEPPPHP